MNPNPPEEYFLPEKSAPNTASAFWSSSYRWFILALSSRHGPFSDEGIVLQERSAFSMARSSIAISLLLHCPDPSTRWRCCQDIRQHLPVARTLLPSLGRCSPAQLSAGKARRDTLDGDSRGLPASCDRLPYRFCTCTTGRMVLAFVALLHRGPLCGGAKGSMAFASGTLVSLTTLLNIREARDFFWGFLLGFVVLGALGAGIFGVIERFSSAHRGSCLAFHSRGFIYFASQGALQPMDCGWTWPLFHYSNRTGCLTLGSTSARRGGRTLFGSGSWTHRLLSICSCRPVLVCR